MLDKEEVKLQLIVSSFISQLCVIHSSVGVGVGLAINDVTQ
jgi:hypothetical protein